MSSRLRVDSSGCPIRARQRASTAPWVPFVHGTFPVRSGRHGPVGEAACHTWKYPARLVCSTMTRP